MDFAPDYSYVEFFDNMDHDDVVYEHKCYCVCWCADDWWGKDFSRVENRMTFARQYLEEQKIQVYLAYYEGRIVGWCNANTRSECLNCAN